MFRNFGLLSKLKKDRVRQFLKKWVFAKVGDFFFYMLFFWLACYSLKSLFAYNHAIGGLRTNHGGCSSLAGNKC